MHSKFDNVWECILAHLNAMFMNVADWRMYNFVAEGLVDIWGEIFYTLIDSFS